MPSVNPVTELPLPGDSPIEEILPQFLERPDEAAESEGLELSPITTPPSRVSTGQRPSIAVHPFNIRTIALLMPAAVLGLLVRLGLEALTTYPGQGIFTLAWVQSAGCLAMGIALGLREPISEYYPEMYIAVTSGFCGSVTTFSSWQLDTFLTWMDDTSVEGPGRLWIYDIVDGIGRLLFTIAISMASLGLGFRLSTDLAPVLFRSLIKKHGPPSAGVHTIVSSVAIATYAVTIPLYLFLPAAYRPKATAALLFSFPGALLRYTLSVTQNPRKPNFPVGTLAANTLGSALLASFYVIQRSDRGTLSPTSCGLIQGLMDGFCGCLTTVSTFSTELRTLSKWNAWRYAFASVMLGQLVMIAILGSSLWSGRVHNDHVCSS